MEVFFAYFLFQKTEPMEVFFAYFLFQKKVSQSSWNWPV